MGDDGGTETAFHERLRGALRASKLGKKELAGKAGISRQHLYDVEQGRSGITVIAASRLAGALGTTVGQLLGESPLAAPRSPARPWSRRSGSPGSCQGWRKRRGKCPI